MDVVGRIQDQAFCSELTVFPGFALSENVLESDGAVLRASTSVEQERSRRLPTSIFKRRPRVCFTLFLAAYIARAVREETALS